MITCFLWNDTTQTWGKAIKIDVLQSPLKLDHRFDESLSTATFLTYDSDCPYTLPIQPWTKCRIIDDSGTPYNYFVSDYEDSIVAYGKKEQPKFGTQRQINISLIEQLAFAFKIFPDNLCFSNDLNQDGTFAVKTINDLLLRVRSQLWTLPESDKGANFENVPFDFTWDTRNSWASKTAPEMFFTDLSLGEILKQVGEVIGGFPELNFDEYLGKYMLSYRMWNDNSTAKHQDGALVNLSRKTTIEQNASVLVSNLKNLQNMALDGENTVTEPCVDEYMPLSTENYVTDIKETNAVFRTKKPIAKILKIQFSILQNGIFYKIDTTASEQHPVFAEFDIWRTLPSANALAVLTPINSSNVCYYQKGDNAIYNLDDSSLNSCGRRIFSLIELVNGIAISGLYSIGRVYARITYIPFQEAKVKTYKPNATKPIMQAFNQGANVVSSNAIANNMQGLVERLDGNSTTYQKRTPRNTKLYKIGEYLNGQVIVSASHEYTVTEINSIYTTAPFNRRSEFIEVANNIRLWAIPEDKVSDRDLHYAENIEVEINPKSTNANNGSLSILGCELLKNYLTANTIPSLAYVAWKKAEDITADIDTDSTNYALATLTSLPLGKSIIMTWSTQDNASMGSRSYNKFNAFPDSSDLQNFIAYDSKAQYLNVRFSNASPTTYLFDANLLPLSDMDANKNFKFTFPASNKKQYTDCLSLADFGQFKIEKDLRERIKFNFQLDFVGKSGTIVYDKGITLNRLCTRTPTTIRIFKDSKTVYSPFEQVVHNDSIEVLGDIGSYNNLAITDADGNLMFATNVGGNATSLNLTFVNRKKEWGKV